MGRAKKNVDRTAESTPKTEPNARAKEPRGERFEPPPDPDRLAAFIREVMEVQVPARALMDGSDGPLAYLVHSFFEGRFVLTPDGKWRDLGPDGPRPPGDAVVWANRGGGKTFLGAVATALDLIFKPGIEVRILGGSAEQSKRMHEHLRRIFELERLSHLLQGRTTEERVRLINGSRVEILSHSERSVRGVRVQKLRCDEVDLFDRALWEAAQLVTRSTSPIIGPWGTEVRGVVEVLSTMHVPMGMMWNIVKESRRVTEWLADAPGPTGSASGSAHASEQADSEGRAGNQAGGGPAPGSHADDTPLPQLPVAQAPAGNGPSRVLFKWGVIDSLEKCGKKHDCNTCALHEECGGRAKVRDEGGHLTVRDALVLKRRVSRAAWEAEMLCREPSRTGCVFAEFAPATHVLPREVTADQVHESGGHVVAGMDFGVRNPTVVVWAYSPRPGELVVVDEYAEVGRTLGDHVAAIKSRAWGPPAWIGIDPAGLARNEQTGVSNHRAMKQMNLEVKAKRTGVAQGIESVRAWLAPASGPPRLKVSPRCTGLIDALCRYHYPADRPSELIPEKDGADHWCDALRYLVVNLEARGIGRGHL